MILCVGNSDQAVKQSWINRQRYAQSEISADQGGEVKSGAEHAEHDGERDQPGGYGATAQETVSVEPGHAM
jgi:hypothetical protein